MQQTAKKFILAYLSFIIEFEEIYSGKVKMELTSKGYYFYFSRRQIEKSGIDGIPIPKKPDIILSMTARPDPYETTNPTTQAKIKLRSDLFGHGHILYYAILITEGNGSRSENGTWNSTDNWPPIPNWKNFSVPYQITPARWNPFRNSDSKKSYSVATYIIGDNSVYDEGFYWNKPLKEKTKYELKIRGFNDAGFQDTNIIYFETAEKLPVARFLLILLAIWITTTIMVCCSIFDFEWIRRLMAASGKKSKYYFSPIPESLSHKNFVKYAQHLLSSPDRLSEEFRLLAVLSSQVSTLCLHGQRVDNKKKNRYGNLLPFDVTRVKLSLIDDDPSTDYINASFIKGYREEVEYIACQGPLEETCHDFYRMILEQNVETIVMLTELVENGEEKCYRYYPDLGQNMRVIDIMISCNAIEESEIYDRRSLIVIRGERQMAINQFHYKQWRDLDCPKSLNDVLAFCELVQKTKGHKGWVVVHGSAGAGRTGTYIALDILLRRIRHNNKINVFGTILKLRQQRAEMVQTESQMRFIYECLREAIEGSPV